ncbi:MULTISPECIES: phosphonate C-P lyase system protein PhnH [Aquitalea]|uniref:phosphonate C-P lyase system protein PhnH n=1 Tax=Aquitalea TaxID=407217 RepID=UPI0018F3EAE7|nr:MULTISPECIES: phosphonate C-P lyase system protein PhnH [Aquitalea]
MMLQQAFDNMVQDCQQVFRCALSALAEPLLPRTLPCLPPALPGLKPSTSALLYTLIDQDVTLWAPTLPEATLASLRFHCALRLADTPEQADFILLPAGSALPPLSSLRAGSPEYPDRSATVLLEVDDFAPQQVEASGPGFASPRRFGATGLPPAFWTQWQANHARFPLGVDVLLLSATQLAGLPHSTVVQEG